MKHNNHEPTLEHHQTWMLVHILYCCSTFSLINHSFQIYSKFIYIKLKESVHSIIYRFWKLKDPSTIYLLVDVIDFFLCLVLVMRSLTVSSMYAPLKYCFVVTEAFVLDYFSDTLLIRILSSFHESVHFLFKFSLSLFFYCKELTVLFLSIFLFLFWPRQDHFLEIGSFSSSKMS